KIIILALLAFLPLGMNAQILKPVSWSFSKEAVKQDTSQQKIYKIHLKASINPGWHVYAQQAGEGPIPTTITFDENDHLKLLGGVEEVGNKIQEYDKVFDSKLSFFENEVDFVQKVAVDKSSILKGSVEFMVCNDHECLPPKDQSFSFKLKDAAGSKIADVGASDKEKEEAAAAASGPQIKSKEDEESDDATGKSLMWIFWAAFGGGLIAL